MAAKTLLILTYIQVLSICLRYPKCNKCILSNKDCHCILDDITGAENLPIVYSLLKARDYCENNPCTKCIYILSKFNSGACDFIQFIEKIGVTQKWNE